MAQKAVLSGTVTRVAKLTAPTRMEFSVSVTSTQMGSEMFTIGTDVNIEVDQPAMQNDNIRNALINLSTGDKVYVELEKNEKGEWKVAKLENYPKRGRTVGGFLNDLEKEIADRQSKSKK